jgi:putative lipoic acid-binding regulatory protein
MILLRAVPKIALTGMFFSLSSEGKYANLSITIKTMTTKQICHKYKS